MADIPKIRFKEFTEPWEQRKFDEVFDCTVPNNTLSRAELSYDEGTVLNVHYGDVLIKYGSVLDVQKDDIPRIPYRCREDFNGALLQDGDVIIADTAEDETTGKACEIGNLQGRAIVSGLHTMVCRPRHRMALGYLGHYLNSNAYHHQLLPLMQGIKVLSLSRSNIQKTSVSYPTVEKEQQLIANYFSQLDNLITLHQRKCDDTKELKKYMLQKMFPKNGEKFPEIRFKGFTEAWEQRKLGEILERRVEQRQQSGEYPRLAFASGQGVIPLNERKTNNREQLTKDEFTKKYLVTELDDIVYNPANVKYGAIDRNKCGRGLISPIYVTFTTSEIPGFIERIVTSHDFQQKALRFEEGTVTKRQSVNPEDFVTIDILVAPQKEEQRKISEYFDSLDNLITLHQRKCDTLKELKKYMLQNMFPKKG